MSVGLQIQRLAPWFGCHHVLMCLNVVSIILVAVMLAGCSTSLTMSGIFITSISYASATIPSSESGTSSVQSILQTARGAAELEVRMNYFGLCARHSGPVWICTPSGGDLRQITGSDIDPLDIIAIAQQLKDRVLFPGFWLLGVVALAISTLLMGTFPGWHYEHDEVTGDDVDVKPFPSVPVTRAVLAFNVCASFSLLVSSLWQHVSAIVVQYTLDISGYGSFTINSGTAAIAMGWAAFAISTVPMLGMWVIILSMSILDRLTE